MARLNKGDKVQYLDKIGVITEDQGIFGHYVNVLWETPTGVGYVSSIDSRMLTVLNK